MSNARTSQAKKAYNDANPVVSFRVPREDYEEVRRRLVEFGKPMSEFMRDSFDGYQVDIETAHSRGVREGYKMAKDRYAVYAPCNTCEQPVALIDKELQQDAARALLNENVLIIIHDDCLPPDGNLIEDCRLMQGEYRPTTKVVH